MTIIKTHKPLMTPYKVFEDRVGSQGWFPARFFEVKKC